MHAYKLRIEFLWGHQSRIVGLSKTNPSYYYPPPTTILGAIAEPIAKEYKLGENSASVRKLLASLSANLLALGLKPVNVLPIKYMDINRILAVKLTGKTLGKKNVVLPYPNPKDLDRSFDAPARGKTIFAPLDFDPPKIDILIVFKENQIYVDRVKVDLDVDLLWDIHRIGSKESIVSVMDVKESRKINIERGISITDYSFPLDRGIKVLDIIDKGWIYETYINPYKLKEENKSILDHYLSSNLLLYMVPIKLTISSEPSVKIIVQEPFAIYNVFFNSNEERVVGVSPKLWPS
ncbi:CRISPR-associated protein, Cas5a family [Staphylothermus marinus F1]|uniref:CRISPR-associated protein, Cas5a family n=1 Tax=Staphylothermus marinus (strain ATCC 43588 / DSM 3639 / JCM 9404 / F1) TaxID=399550 RepID=A3DLC5_STAMF|nr:type I-E CRISPR-associated protein Cas5/CasD [Staphylothermus marinus]ABN69435.1 CRISPR-associated protein, Cas5a family [Staphylothermus marinus F1]